jgi:hypothetical protein
VLLFRLSNNIADGAPPDLYALGEGYAGISKPLKLNDVAKQQQQQQQQEQKKKAFLRPLVLLRFIVLFLLLVSSCYCANYTGGVVFCCV